MNVIDLAAKYPGALLLFAEVLLFWSIANYGTVPDPVRGTNGEHLRVDRSWLGIVAARTVILVSAIVAVGNLRAWPLALVAGGGSLLLPVARWKWVPARYIAELELATNLVIWYLTITIVARCHLQAARGWITSAQTVNHTAALCLIGALVIFTMRGGTYIVRGILNKCGALPTLPVPVTTSTSSIMSHKDTVQESAERFELAAQAEDPIEVNRGRWIGNLERLLLLAIVSEGSYPAIAFLIAAKSLIRSKELEHRDWAEYFLIGTLASIAVALGTGLAIRRVIAVLW